MKTLMKRISDADLAELFISLESIRKDDGSFENKKLEHQFVQVREQIIKRFINEQGIRILI